MRRLTASTRAARLGLHLGMARVSIALACTALVCGCGAILGDFTDGVSTDSGTPAGNDGGKPPNTEDGSVGIDSPVSEDGAAPDNFVPPSDGGTDSADATPPPNLDAGPPGNPGLAITTGGTYSTSAHFLVIGAMGESPGGNLTSSSTNFKLQSGVIGATQ